MKKHKILSSLFIVIVLATISFSPKISVGVNDLYLKLSVLNDMISIVNEYYVDDVDWEKAMTGMYKGFLEELDPHSIYIEKKQLKSITEEFQGNFQGIGIEFDIIEGYITVISPIVGTPSERAGLQPGDKFLEIDHETAKDITREQTFKRLRGKKGSKVVLTVQRYGVAEAFDVNIIRDDIPIYSVLAHFIYDNNTGYILVNRFSGTTSEEFNAALADLKEQGMKSLILDLRFNGGGYLNQAVEMLDDFLEKDDLIVYTKGRVKNTNETFYASGKGKYKDIPIIVMINQGSASASEIVSGAIQDLDRGIIVGETSFGKGLVQRQWPLKDGSAVRVTVARYYTPTGRLIQRSYENGIEKYYEEVMSNHSKQDSSKTDLEERPEFTTKSGRIVLGGGGITPDIKVKREFDLTESSMKIFRHAGRIFFNYGQNYINTHGENFGTEREFIFSYKFDENFIESVYEFALNYESDIKLEELEEDKENIEMQIRSEIAKSLWGNNAFYTARLLYDNQFESALNAVPSARDLAKLSVQK